MEPEGSLPHSQVTATCPYPEPDQSNSDEVAYCFTWSLLPDYKYNLFLKLIVRKVRYSH